MHLFVDHPPISLRRRQNFPLRQEEGAAPAVKSKVRPGMPNWSFSAAERTTSTWKPHLSMVFFWVICLASLILMVLVSPVFCWNCVNIYLYIHTFSVRLSMSDDERNICQNQRHDPHLWSKKPGGGCISHIEQKVWRSKLLDLPRLHIDEAGWVSRQDPTFHSPC